MNLNKTCLYTGAHEIIYLEAGTLKTATILNEIQVH